MFGRMGLFGKRDRCRVCKAEMSLTTVDTVGRHGNVETVLKSFPILECPSLHTRRTAHGDQGADLMSALYRYGGLEGPRPSSIEGIIESDLCDYCDNSVVPDGDIVEIEVDVPPTRLRGGFGLIIRLPRVTCPGCGRNFVGAGKQIGSDIADALIDAYESAAIDP